jgi:hypothetical protein
VGPQQRHEDVVDDLGEGPVRQGEAGQQGLVLDPEPADDAGRARAREALDRCPSGALRWAGR